MSLKSPLLEAAVAAAFRLGAGHIAEIAVEFGVAEHELRAAFLAAFAAALLEA